MNTVNVRFRRVDEVYIEDNYEVLLEDLYSSRRMRVKRYNNKKVAYTSLVAGSLLQTALRDLYGLSPEDICIKTGSEGKPYVANCPDFKYNLSHSDGGVVLAYGSMEVGIDIEKIKKPDLKVARRCFTDSEYEYIMSDERKSAKRFFQIWTMKESFLKLSGIGITVPLNSFCVDPYKNVLKSGGEAFFHMEMIDEYIVSVCTRERSKNNFFIDNEI